MSHTLITVICEICLSIRHTLDTEVLEYIVKLSDWNDNNNNNDDFETFYGIQGYYTTQDSISKTLEQTYYPSDVITQKLIHNLTNCRCENMNNCNDT
jgi:hypothetical protein